ncbi:UxaA family hydrolase [Flavicella sediminum]|uniref:UxaA family hydrolase n=1 Tax=Flavicella sediminum TaxID=2585141 RepID=UPI001120D16A
MGRFIDFNTGALIEGASSIEKTGGDLLDLVNKVASGGIHAKARKLNQDDFIPWKRGMSL